MDKEKTLPTDTFPSQQGTGFTYYHDLMGIIRGCIFSAGEGVKSAVFRRREQRIGRGCIGSKRRNVEITGFLRGFIVLT